MAESIQSVELSAVLVTDPEGRYLLDFNDNWGSFSFPMSKQRELPSIAPGGASTMETPLSAAIRAAAEVLGRPIAPSSLKPLPIEIQPWNQSGNDGKWKRYTFHVYSLAIRFAPAPVSGRSVVWLTKAELETLEPMSPTVGQILATVA